MTPPAQKYGVYVVDGNKFLLKSTALKAAKKDRSKIKFSMLGVSELDLSQDPFPGVSIKDLYRIRAQELRDQYDYLVLNLSGGPDSMNILDAFVENNIPLDEIVNHNSVARTGVVDGTTNNSDYVYNIKPKISELQKLSNFRTKITIVDEIESVQTQLTNTYRIGNETLIQEIGGPNRSTSVSGQSIQNVDHIWKMIRDGNSVGVISGVDKPTSRILNGKRFLQYTDNLRGQFVEFINDHQVSAFWEWFYQGDLRIVHKQCYLLKQFVDTHPQSEYYELFEQQDKTTRSAIHWPSNDGKHNLKYSYFHAVVYPGMQQNFITPKDANILLRPRDNWWIFKLDKKLQKLYSYGIASWFIDAGLHHQHDVWEATQTPVFYEKIWLL